MNYESIKTRIKTLIAEAQQKPASRIDAALEPIREDMLEARSHGVRIAVLYAAIEAETKNISPSSFAKYAQRHLQVRKQRGNRCDLSSTRNFTIILMAAASLPT